MRFMPHHLFSLAAVFALTLTGCATSDTRQSSEQQLRAAETTFANFQSDPNMAWFRSNVKNARAVLIAPRVTRGGFIFGGSGGYAVLFARDGKTGGWAGPAFYNMGAATFGLQAGVDVSEIVVLVMTDKALDALLSKSVKVGGDASVAAGPVGTSASATPRADMVSISRAKGVFAGLTIDGASISPDNDANSAFYGGPVSPADILIRQSVKNPSASSLQQALAGATK